MRPVHFFLRSVLCLSCTFANAQRSFHPQSKPFDDPHVRTIIRRQQSINAPLAKGNAVSECLNGFINRSYNDAVTVSRFDSTRFYYNAAQPSRLDNNNPDSYREVMFSGYPIQAWPSLLFSNRPSIGFDSAYSLQMDWSGEISDHYISRKYSGHLLVRQDDTFVSRLPYAAGRLDHYSFAYNTDSQITLANYKIASTSDISGTSFRTFSSGLVTRDSFVSLDGPIPILLSIGNYAYDPSGNLDTITNRYWTFNYAGRISNRESYAYSSNNLLLAHFHENRDTPQDSLQMMYVDSFFYAGTRVSNVIRHGWNAVDSTWGPSYNMHFQYHFDTLGNVDTLVESTMAPVPVSNKRTVYKYTPGGHLDEIRTFTTQSNGTFNTYPSERTKFYYQTATPQSITHQGNSADYVRVYPNPAESRLYIRLRQTPHAPVSVMLLNTAGQVIRTEVLNNGTGELPVSDLAAGAYFLEFVDPESNYSVPFVKH